jgi:hypothetical protein
MLVKRKMGVTELSERVGRKFTIRSKNKNWEYIKFVIFLYHESIKINNRL